MDFCWMSYSVFQGRFGQGQEHAREQALSEGASSSWSTTLYPIQMNLI
jgi:hypothetical protein